MRWNAQLIFSAYVALIAASVAFGTQAQTPVERLRALLWLSGMWVVGTVGMELLLRSRLAFELHLLPGAVRLKTWRRNILLIEPEIVGGCIDEFRNQIKLRAGAQTATIRLGWFSRRGSERAAIVEHCSQFLTAEQQAEFGPKWAEQYYQLLTPRKPPQPQKLNPWHTLLALALGYAFTTSVLAYNLEYCIQNGLTHTTSGMHLRYCHLIWFGVYTLFGCLIIPLYVAESWKSRRENDQLLISKIASTSTAAPVGSAANPSAERA